jgi:hypothetical protein
MRLMRTTRMKPDPRWSADEVMGRVVEMNDARAKALERYSSVRTYHLECHCVSHKKADMVVRTDYQAPNKKEFTIVSESGSGTVRDRVFKKLLEAEQESMGMRISSVRRSRPRTIHFKCLTTRRPRWRSTRIVGFVTRRSATTIPDRRWPSCGEPRFNAVSDSAHRISDDCQHVRGTQTAQ